MKSKYYKLLAFVMVAGLAVSCKRTLETEPLEQLSPDYIWDTQDSLGTNAGKVLADIYSMIPNGFNRVIAGDGQADFLDAATDDAISSSVVQTPVQLIATGQGINPNNNQEGGTYGGDGTFWNNDYIGIRKANIFIANIDKVPLEGVLSDGRPLRAAWKAEARFLRAYFYFELVKRYGGVPLMGNKVYQITDNVLLPRNSFSDCINYITNECDSVKDKLRYDPIDNVNYGRVTRGTAMALKARVLLYAASPLYNNAVNSGKEVAGYTNYDASRWSRAASAASDIIKLGVFGLNPKFTNVFITADQSNNEVIFARNNGPSFSIETNNGPVGFGGNAKGNGRTSPTQELVDAFGTLNGKPINQDPYSNPADTGGYNPNNPYAHRDPRMEATVIHQGSKWLNTTIQTYDGSQSKPGGSKIQTRTSYYLRKFMGNFETQSQYANVSHNFIIFRYAEVLLNFAEATNEVAGPTADVYNSLVALRKRAGILKGTGTYGYGLPEGISKDSMRSVIQNERRVEFAFEEHRYWDIRRWKIAEKVMNSPLHGLDITSSHISGSFAATPIVVENPVFTQQMYLYPISQSELNKNRNLVQNPYWPQ